MAYCSFYVKSADAEVPAGTTEVLTPPNLQGCMGMVVMTPAEYAALTASPFYLSAEDGMAVSVAIVGIWSAAYFWRSLRKSLGGNDGATDD